jgi:hypothetical protein
MELDSSISEKRLTPVELEPHSTRILSALPKGSTAFDSSLKMAIQWFAVRIEDRFLYRRAQLLLRSVLLCFINLSDNSRSKKPIVRARKLPVAEIARRVPVRERPSAQLRSADGASYRESTDAELITTLVLGVRI